MPATTPLEQLEARYRQRLSPSRGFSDVVAMRFRHRWIFNEGLVTERRRAYPPPPYEREGIPALTYRLVRLDAFRQDHSPSDSRHEAAQFLMNMALGPPADKRAAQRRFLERYADGSLTHPLRAPQPEGSTRRFENRYSDPSVSNHIRRPNTSKFGSFVAESKFARLLVEVNNALEHYPIDTGSIRSAVPCNGHARLPTADPTRLHLGAVVLTDAVAGWGIDAKGHVTAPASLLRILRMHPDQPRPLHTSPGAGYALVRPDLNHRPSPNTD